MPEEKYNERLNKVYEFAEKAMPKLPYHNFDHATRFCWAIVQLNQREKVSLQEQYLLKTAALLHDIGYSRGEKEHEEKGVIMATQVLQEFGYTKDEIKVVSDLIMATKIGHRPRNLLEEMMHDADLAVLGTEDFFDASERLRIERKEDKMKWNLETQLSFLKDFHYLTKSANGLWGPTFRENLKKLEGDACS